MVKLKLIYFCSGVVSSRTLAGAKWVCVVSECCLCSPVVRRQAHANDMTMQVNQLVHRVKSVCHWVIVKPVGLWGPRRCPRYQLLSLQLRLSLSLSYSLTQTWPWVQFMREVNWLDPLEPWGTHSMLFYISLAHIHDRYRAVQIKSLF